MKKILTIILVTIVGIGVLLLQFCYDKTYQPYTFYRVYLDSEVIGVLETREELDEYISKQGELIRNQVVEYETDLTIIEGLDDVIENKFKNIANQSNYFNDREGYKKISMHVDYEGKFSKDVEEEVLRTIGKLSNQPAVINNKILDYDKWKNDIEINIAKEKERIVSYVSDNVDKLSDTEKYYLEEYNKRKLSRISYVKQVYMRNYVDLYGIYLSTNDIYAPVGVTVEKIRTYDKTLSTAEEVYQKIVAVRPCTIEGYQFRIKKTAQNEISKYASVGGLLLEDYDDIILTNNNDTIVYVTDEKIFKDAVTQLERVFVGSDKFDLYDAGLQKELDDVGTKIDDVYVDEDITVKKVNISVGEKIYNEENDLADYLLYGDNKNIRTVYAKSTDTIFSIVEKNGITLEEFFLSNPSFTSVNNFLYENQPIVIAQIDPQLSIVVESYVVEDKVVEYQVVEKYDKKYYTGYKEVVQQGSNGLERTAQNIKTVNGTITFVNPVSNQTIKKATDKIIVYGTKSAPKVGSTGSWYWPTNSGYTITSYYGYRTHPITKKRHLHSGIDIAGTGYGSPVYASNNGTIYTIKSDKYNYGKHIIIDHHNGYYSLYAHMSAFAKGMSQGATVQRGQVIGYVGQTGSATGPHLHFEIRTCNNFNCITNPLPYLKKK